MRILHIIPSLDLAYGGPPEGLRRLAAGYLREGHDVEVATLDDPRAEFLRELPFPVSAHGPRKNTYGYSPTLLPWLRENASRFDGVVVNGLWQYHGRAAWLALHGRQRYAVFMHGMLDPYFNKPYLTKFAKKWPYWLFNEYKLIRDAHRVLFTSEAEMHLAAKSMWPYRAEGMVVPYGTPGPGKDTALYRRAFLELCPQMEEKRFLLFLGRIHPKKGCDLLIEAFAAAAAADLHLVIAGPDQTGWKAQLEARAVELGVADRIHWPGMLSGDTKWGAYFCADAFILPSHQENFGISVAEALACRLPVLISDQVNIHAEVKSDGAAIVEPDTLDGTRRMIEQWENMPVSQKDAMRAAARRCFEQRYNSQRLPSSIVSLFQSS
ncbi:glycosyltransferase [Silvibacterium dinghuense]|uniref:Glycosyltransferase n=1 Tax=Silvibacterium dinghuense TaxID=1560006 RepID=A0A4Q1SG45_9BACT|nr:glycosyltransferase [Silvibacterium dinghuense]RXS96506.1 glycosyltransferase [Silvibacterium dinghuense]GGG91360.1 glycosyl transferase family 1 [Silvibacterium dinghuense]